MRLAAADAMTRERRDDEREERGGFVIGPTAGGADVNVEPSGPHARGGLRDDPAIAGDVSRRLHEHGSLDASAIRVDVRHGRVVLEGRVADEPARHVAELIADAVPGVRGVDNRLDAGGL
jgi:osmotically-inducible protein OsmY